jgi:hypothetical protein
VKRKDDTIYHLLGGSSVIPGGPVDKVIRGVGCSEYSLLCNTIDYSSFLAAIQHFKCRHTRITCWNAWSTGIDYPGVVNGYFPCFKNLDGRFDMYNWNHEYFNRLRAITEEANARGILPIFSVLELYTWSVRKSGVPTQSLQPFQNNVNGIYWSDRDSDAIWGELAQPGDWIWAFAEKFSRATDGLTCGLETGNELPEKALHARIFDAFRSAGFVGPIQTNRQEDKPSMYPNMISGVELGGVDKRDYSTISWHGKSSMAYLDEEFPENPDRPSSYRKMWDHDYDGPFYPRDKMVFSSDGCRKYNDRIETYDWSELVPVALQVISEGTSYEHQSCTKMRMYLGGEFNAQDVYDYDSKLLIPAIDAWEKLQ